MKLFHSPTSPYVRKVMVTAIEKGLDGQIEKMPTSASPIKREGALPTKNPLAKVPCLITDDGRDIRDMTDDQVMDWVVEQQHAARGS